MKISNIVNCDLKGTCKTYRLQYMKPENAIGLKEYPECMECARNQYVKVVDNYRPDVFIDIKTEFE